MTDKIEELFDKDFSADVKRSLTENILVGMKAFGQFMIDNKNFFTYDNYSSLKGELLTYCVNKSITDGAFTPNSLYRTKDADVNNFRRGIVHLSTENFLATVNRTRNRNLPGVSKYKKEYAKANSGSDGQYSLMFGENNMIANIARPQYYAILTYGYRFDKKIKGCTHIQLLVPDEHYKQVVYRKDLLDEHSKQAELVDVSKYHEKQIVKMKKEMEQLVKLKEIK